jgi:hypothetical protein
MTKFREFKAVLNQLVVDYKNTTDKDKKNKLFKIIRAKLRPLTYSIPTKYIVDTFDSTINYSLIQALNKFEPNKSEFGGYYLRWLNSYAKRDFIKTRKSLNIPEEIFFGMQKLTPGEIHKLAAGLEVEELTSKTGLAENYKERLQDACMVAEQEYIDSDFVLLADERGYAEFDFDEDLKSALAHLQFSDREMLIDYFGLFGRPECTTSDLKKRFPGKSLAELLEKIQSDEILKEGLKGYLDG